MSPPDSKTKSKCRRAVPTESIITTFKSDQKKCKVKNHDDVRNKIIKHKKPGTLKMDIKKPVGGKETDTSDSVDVNKTAGSEYYPLKHKRDVISRKIQMKSRHELTVIGQTNKRKRSIPKKDSSSLTQSYTSDLYTILKQSLVSRVPTESMYELIEETEKNGGLNDEDLQEILTCESPVWWEDAPDGYTEDPLFTRPRSATDMYPSVRTQLKRDFRALKRAHSPIGLSKKCNKKNVLNTIIKPRKRQNNNIDLTDGENGETDISNEEREQNKPSNKYIDLTDSAIEISNEEKEKKEVSDIDFRIALNNCDDTFIAKRSKLESAVKKITVKSNIVVSVTTEKNGAISLCSKVSVIKNLNSKCEQDVGEALNNNNKGIEDTLHGGDCVSDLKNVNISVPEEEEGITMKQLMPPIDEVICQNERNNHINEDGKTQDDDLIEERNIINDNIDLQSITYSEDSDTFKICETEGNVYEEIRAKYNDVINTDSDVSQTTDDTQTAEMFDVSQINKCLDEIEVSGNIEKTQSDDSFEGTRSDNSEESSSDSLFEDTRYDSIAKEQPKNCFEEASSYKEIKVPENYFKSVENENFGQEIPQNYYEKQPANVEEVQSRDNTQNTQSENLREYLNLARNSYAESQRNTNPDQEDSGIYIEGVQSRISEDVQSENFFPDKEQSEIFFDVNHCAQNDVHCGGEEHLQSQNCIDCMQPITCKEIDENIKHVESNTNPQTKNIQVQSENYLQYTHSNKNKIIQVAVNYEQESEFFLENTQNDNYEETEIATNREHVEPENCEQTQTNFKLAESENCFEVQPENVKQMQHENYLQVKQSEKYKEIQVEESNNYYENLQSENIDQQAENYYVSMPTVSYIESQGALNLQQTGSAIYYEHVSSENIKNLQAENHYEDIQSGHYEINFQQPEFERYHVDKQLDNYKKTQLDTDIKLAESEYIQSDNNENVEFENYIEAVQPQNYQETQSENCYDYGRSENVERSELIQGVQQSDNGYEEKSHEQKKSENYSETLHSSKYDETQYITIEQPESQIYMENVQSEHYSEVIQSDMSYVEEELATNNMQEECENFLEVTYSANNGDTNVAMNIEQIDSENYLNTMNPEQVLTEKYVEVTDAAENTEQVATDMKSLPTEHGFGKVEVSNNTSVPQYIILKLNNYQDLQSLFTNINYEEIITDSNFDTIDVSNYEKVQTVYNSEENCYTVSSNQQVVNINSYESNTICNVKDTQDASNFIMQSANDLKLLKNTYEDISTDSSSDAQIVRKLRETVNGSNEIEPHIQIVENPKEIAVASDLKNETFTKYTSISEIFDNNFGNKQDGGNPTNVQVLNEGIPPQYNDIIPASNDLDDVGDIIFTNKADGTVFGVPTTSDLKRTPITNSGSDLEKNQHPDPFLLGILSESTFEKTHTTDNAKNINKCVQTDKQINENETKALSPKITTASDFNITENVNNVKNVTKRKYNKRQTQNVDTHQTRSKTKQRLLKDSLAKSSLPTNLSEDNEVRDEGVSEIEKILEVKFLEGEIEHKDPGNKSSLLKRICDDGNSMEITRFQSVPRKLPPLKNSVKKHNGGDAPISMPPPQQNPDPQAGYESQLMRTNLDSISDTNLRFLNEDDEEYSLSRITRYTNVTESNERFKLVNSNSNSTSNTDILPINDLNSNSQLLINKTCQCGKHSKGPGDDVEIQNVSISKVNGEYLCAPTEKCKRSIKYNQGKRHKAIKNNDCVKATTADNSKMLKIHEPEIKFGSEFTKNVSDEECVPVFEIVLHNKPEFQINMRKDLFQRLSNVSNSEIESKDLDTAESNKDNPEKFKTVPQNQVTTDEERDIIVKKNNVRSKIKLTSTGNTKIKDSVTFKVITETDVTIADSHNLLSMKARKDILNTDVKRTDLEISNKIILEENAVTVNKIEKRERANSNSEKKVDDGRKINHYFKKSKKPKQQKSSGNKNLDDKNRESNHKSKTLDKNKRHKVEKDELEKNLTNRLKLQNYRIPKLAAKNVNVVSDLNTGHNLHNELNNNKTNDKDELKNLYKNDKQSNNAVPTHETYPKQATNTDIIKKDKDLKTAKDTEPSLSNPKPFRYCILCKSIYYAAKCNYCFGKNGEQLYRHNPRIKQFGPDYSIKTNKSSTCDTCSYKTLSKESLQRHIESKCCRNKR